MIRAALSIGGQVYKQIPDPRDEESQWNTGWRFNIGLLSALLLTVIFWSVVATMIGLFA